MPYIKLARKEMVDVGAPLEDAKTAGELNYQITAVIKTYMDVNGKSYQTINDIIGALEGAKLEFYRRIAAPYEDTKIKENGDIY